MAKDGGMRAIQSASQRRWVDEQMGVNTAMHMRVPSCSPKMEKRNRKKKKSSFIPGVLGMTRRNEREKYEGRKREERIWQLLGTRTQTNKSGKPANRNCS